MSLEGGIDVSLMLTGVIGILRDSMISSLHGLESFVYRTALVSYRSAVGARGLKQQSTTTGRLYFYCYSRSA